MNTEKITIAIFAGGCFWCTEAVFKRIEGVREVMPGYTGGHVKNPSYREVCMGTTGHAEAIKITYDENTVSYEKLVMIFFSTHDPTTLNRQGNDIGTPYRSSIFYTDDIQKTIAENYIIALQKQQVFNSTIVTELLPFTTFYEAEEDHKNYYDLHRNEPYCQYIILPKLQKLDKELNISKN